MSNTTQEYHAVIAKCKDTFFKKMKDYGASWRVLRPSSLTDQIFIKANRIKTIQIKGVAKIEEDIAGEFMAIINYCIISLIQIELKDRSEIDLSPEEGLALYEKYADKAFQLMMDKNHDYGEAWRDMRVSTFTDMLLMRVLRIKQIEDNQGNTLVSEGVESNYFDMVNYSVFALIQLGEAC